MNFKSHKSLTVLNAPGEFAAQIKDFGDFLEVKTEWENKALGFVLVFCRKQAEVEKWASLVCQKLEGDALLWFAYPKKSSKKYSSDFHRDRGWDSLGKLAYEPVRMVAIDEDWSAVRFRKVEYIKELKRNPDWIKSEEGKAKAKRK